MMVAYFYNPSSVNSSTEPYPEGTSVSFPLKDPTISSNTLMMHGTVILVPICPLNSQPPLSDADAPPYTIRLVDGSIHKVSPDFLSTIATMHSSDNNLQKVMYLHDGLYHKGIMEWDLDSWHFSQC